MNKRLSIAVLFAVIFAGIGIFLLLGSYADNVTTPSITNSTNAGSVAFFNTQNYTDSVTDSANYQVMVIQYNGNSSSPTYSPRFVAQLHAANPSVKVLMYQDPSFARVSDTSGEGVCVDWQANGSSPTAYPGGLDTSWFLKDQNGNPIPATNSGSEPDYLLDKGNTAYQQSCLTHAITYAKSAGFDGVYWDNTDPQIYYVPSGTSIPAYPNPASWQTATDSFLQYADTQLHAQGLLNAANVGTSYSNGVHVWEQYGAYLDVTENEAYMTDNLNTESASANWLYQEADDLWSEQNSKLVIEHSYSGTETGNTYGLASMLLVADGQSSYSTSNSSTSGQCYGTNCEANYPEYSISKQLGLPSGAVAPSITTSSVGAGTSIYRRTFANGLVIVNPTSASSGVVALGASYTGSCGAGSSSVNSVSSLTLGADTGCILIKNQPVVVSTPPSSPASVINTSPTTTTSSSAGSTTTNNKDTVKTAVDTPSSSSANVSSNAVTLSSSSSDKSAPVSGTVTISTGPTPVKSVVYYLDGKVVKSLTIDTKDLSDGPHTVEAVITEPDGKVVIEKKIINVNNHRGFVKQAELKYGDTATLSTISVSTLILLVIIAFIVRQLIFRSKLKFGHNTIVKYGDWFKRHSLRYDRNIKHNTSPPVLLDNKPAKTDDLLSNRDPVPAPGAVINPLPKKPE